MGRKIIIAVTGASGAIYARELLNQLQDLIQDSDVVNVVFSTQARDVWAYELGNKDYEQLPFRIFEKTDFSAPFASGSAAYDTMIIIPCSMGTLGRIASGISNDLITRSADVILKERARLILVARETPLNLIHLRNMVSITEAGGIICPAIPSFYSAADHQSAIIRTLTNRVLKLAGFSSGGFEWGSEREK